MVANTCRSGMESSAYVLSTVGYFELDVYAHVGLIEQRRTITAQSVQCLYISGSLVTSSLSDVNLSSLPSVECSAER